MKREDAKEILRQSYFKKMTVKDRLEKLEELWISCDEEDYFEDEELKYYSKEIRNDMITNDKPKNPEDIKYDYIIKDRQKSMFYGVKNDYIIKLLREININVNSISGNNDILEACDCCSYNTITPGEDGLCQICPVCFWENFGEGPNGMTILQAKENFKKYGAMDEKFLKAIDLNGKMKYEKTN